MNNCTETSLSSSKRRIQEETDSSSFQLQQNENHQCRCIKESDWSQTTTAEQSRQNIISSMLHKKIYIYKTKLWYTQSENASHHESIRKMKKLSIRNTTSDNCQVRLQESSVLHDDKKT